MLIRYDSLSIILCTSYFILHCEDAQKRIEFSKRNSIIGEGLSKASSEVHKTTNKQLYDEFFTFPCASKLNLDAQTWIENSVRRKCCDNLWSISTRNGNWMSDGRFFLRSYHNAVCRGSEVGEWFWFIHRHPSEIKMEKCCGWDFFIHENNCAESCRGFSKHFWGKENLIGNGFQWNSFRIFQSKWTTHPDRYEWFNPGDSTSPCDSTVINFSCRDLTKMVDCEEGFEHIFAFCIILGWSLRNNLKFST